MSVSAERLALAVLGSVFDFLRKNAVTDIVGRHVLGALRPALQRT